MTPNTRTLKGQSYCSQRWANPVWPKGSKSRGFSTRALGIGGKEDHLVLNSVSNVARAYRHLDGYGQIKCYLDNDEAGRRTLGALLARYGGRVSNCSGIYDGCKDLNEHLQRVLAERQAQSENEKKNKSIRL